MYLCICIPYTYVMLYSCHNICVEAREEITVVDSLFLSCWSQGLKSDIKHLYSLNYRREETSGVGDDSDTDVVLRLIKYLSVQCKLQHKKGRIISGTLHGVIFKQLHLRK